MALVVVVLVVNVLEATIFVRAGGPCIFIIFFLRIFNNRFFLLPFHHLDSFFKFVLAIDVLLRIVLYPIAYFLDVVNLNFALRKLHRSKQQVIGVKVEIVLGVETDGHLHCWGVVADFFGSVHC